jgi:hypothetical protein
MPTRLPDDWRNKFAERPDYVLSKLIHRLTIHARGTTYGLDYESVDDALQAAKSINEQIHFLSGMLFVDTIDWESLEGTLVQLFETGPLTVDDFQRVLSKA